MGGKTPRRLDCVFKEPAGNVAVMVFIYHVLSHSESTYGFWRVGGERSNAAGCTLSPCSEDVAIDFLYLNKIINSVPLNLAVSCLSHPAQRCCSQAGENASRPASPSKHRRGAALLPPAVLHPTALSLSLGTAEHREPLERDKRVSEVVDLTSARAAGTGSWRFSSLKLLFAEGITSLVVLFATCSGLVRNSFSF